MIADELRKELQNIIGGNVLKGEKDHCTAISNFLRQSFGSNPTAKKEFESRAVLKEKQGQFLTSYAVSNGYWMSTVPEGSSYLTRGGEATVYLARDQKHVIKVNDAIYYATWSEFFSSLVIHNLLFPNTAYELIGFTQNGIGALCVVLQQPFVEGGQAELDDIKDHLTFNGFRNTRRQDYFNDEFGLLLEDMHDENVIAKGDVLFFIDTVFYIMAAD